MSTRTPWSLAVVLIPLALLACTAGPDARGLARTSSAAAPTAPDGLYGVTADGSFVYVDPATARVRVIGQVGLPTSPAGADFSCDGTFYALAGADGALLLYTVDLATGVGEPLEVYRTGYQGVGFEFGLDEETPYWRDGTAFYRLDRSTSTVEQVATLQGDGVSLTVPATCDGFLTGSSLTTSRIDRIDPVSFAVTPVIADVKVAFTALAATPDGRLYGSSSGQLYLVDLALGQATLIGPMTDSEEVFTLLGMSWGPHSICCKAQVQPPDCSAATATPATIWPPNHRFVAVGVEGVVAPDGAPVTIEVVSVRQDEPVDALGDGHTGPDASLADGILSVRAERSGTGNGRVYQVGFTATANGASCSGTVSVCVPHDQGQGSSCIDDGPAFDSFAP